MLQLRPKSVRKPASSWSTAVNLNRQFIGGFSSIRLLDLRGPRLPATWRRAHSVRAPDASPAIRAVAFIYAFDGADVSLIGCGLRVEAQARRTGCASTVFARIDLSRSGPESLRCPRGELLAVYSGRRALRGAVQRALTSGKCYCKRKHVELAAGRQNRVWCQAARTSKTATSPAQFVSAFIDSVFLN